MHMVDLGAGKAQTIRIRALEVGWKFPNLYAGCPEIVLEMRIRRTVKITGLGLDEPVIRNSGRNPPPKSTVTYYSAYGRFSKRDHNP